MKYKQGKMYYYFHSWQKDLKYFKDKRRLLNSKTILGLSFTTVFILSTLSAITAIQADAMFKIKHLPELKQTKSENIIMRLDTSVEKIEPSFDKMLILTQSSLNKQLKN